MSNTTPVSPSNTPVQSDNPSSKKKKGWFGFGGNNKSAEVNPAQPGVTQDIFDSTVRKEEKKENPVKEGAKELKNYGTLTVIGNLPTILKDVFATLKTQLTEDGELVDEISKLITGKPREANTQGLTQGAIASLRRGIDEWIIKWTGQEMLAKFQEKDPDLTMMDAVSICLTGKPVRGSENGLIGNTTGATVNGLVESIINALVQEATQPKQDVDANAEQLLLPNGNESSRLQDGEKVEDVNQEIVLSIPAEEVKQEESVEQRKFKASLLVNAITFALVGSGAADGGILGTVLDVVAAKTAAAASQVIKTTATTASQVAFGEDVSNQEGGLAGAASRLVEQTTKNVLDQVQKMTKETLDQVQTVRKETLDQVAQMMEPINSTANAVAEALPKINESIATLTEVVKNAATPEQVQQLTASINNFSNAATEFAKLVDPITTAIPQVMETVQSVQAAVPGVTQSAQQIGGLAETVTNAVSSVGKVFGQSWSPKKSVDVVEAPEVKTVKEKKVTIETPKVKTEKPVKEDTVFVFAEAVEELIADLRFSDDSMLILRLLNPLLFIARGILYLLNYLTLYPLQEFGNLIFEEEKPVYSSF